MAACGVFGASNSGAGIEKLGKPSLLPFFNGEVSTNKAVDVKVAAAVTMSVADKIAAMKKAL